MGNIGEEGADDRSTMRIRINRGPSKGKRVKNVLAITFTVD